MLIQSTATKANKVMRGIFVQVTQTKTRPWPKSTAAVPFSIMTSLVSFALKLQHGWSAPLCSNNQKEKGVCRKTRMSRCQGCPHDVCTDMSSRAARGSIGAMPILTHLHVKGNIHINQSNTFPHAFPAFAATKHRHHSLLCLLKNHQWPVISVAVYPQLTKLSLSGPSLAGL